MVGLRADKASLANTGRVQCMGQNIPASDMGDGISGPGPDGIEELRHGIVDGAYVFRVRKTDPPTSGASAQRSERYFAAPNELIPQGDDVWFGVRIKTSGWDSDTYRVITQWHEASAVSGLSPHFSATLNGTRLRVLLLHNNNEVLTSGSTTQVEVYVDETWVPDRWYDFVVKARVNPEGGYLHLWVDGELAGSYTGPFGYRYDSPKDYAKVGMYHWNSAGNQWREGAPEVIETKVKSMLLLRDQPGVSAGLIRDLLQ